MPGDDDDFGDLPLDASSGEDEGPAVALQDEDAFVADPALSQAGQKEKPEKAKKRKTQSTAAPGDGEALEVSMQSCK